MSDIHNTDKPKQLYTTLLGGKSGKEAVGKFTINRPLLPMSTVSNPKEAYEYLKRNKVPVLRPSELRKLENVPIRAFVSKRYRRVLESRGVDTKTQIPMPLSDEQVIPSYRPGNFASVPAEGLFSQIKYQASVLANAGADLDELKDQIMYLKNTAETVAYGTGTLSGQLARVVAVYQVSGGRGNHHRNKSLWEMRYTAEDIALLLESSLPLKASPAHPGLIRLLSGMILTKEEEEQMGNLGVSSFIPPITGDSLAGMPFMNNKKHEVLIQNTAIADTVILKVSEMMKESGDKLTANPNVPGHGRAHSEAMTNFAKWLCEEHWYLACGLLFPKAERYDIATWDTKTRNIWSAPFATHLLANQISSPVMDEAINLLQFPMTSSLAKLSLTQGGMNSFITDHLLNASSEGVYIYADNIYIRYPSDEKDEYDWYSIDLTKGEANATRSHASAVAYYLLTRGWVDEEGGLMYNRTWAFIACSLVPSLIVDSLMLIQNLQLRNRGQGSGNAWTFLINHVLSTVLVDQWRKAGRPRPGSIDFMGLAAVTGIDFKIELETKGVSKQLRALKEGAKTIDNYLESNDVSRVVQMDLLGYSCTYVEGLGYIPVLDKPRLAQTIILPKIHGEGKQSNAYQLAKTYIRTASAIMVGGWAYPVWREALYSTCHSVFNNLSNLVMTSAEDPRELIQRAVQLCEFREDIKDVDFTRRFDLSDVTKILQQKPIQQFMPRTFVNPLTIFGHTDEQLELYGGGKKALLTENKGGGKALDVAYVVRQSDGIGIEAASKLLPWYGLSLDDITVSQDEAEQLVKAADKLMDQITTQTTEQRAKTLAEALPQVVQAMERLPPHTKVMLRMTANQGWGPAEMKAHNKSRNDIAKDVLLKFAASHAGKFIGAWLVEEYGALADTLLTPHDVFDASKIKRAAEDEEVQNPRVQYKQRPGGAYGELTYATNNPTGPRVERPREEFTRPQWKKEKKKRRNW